MYSSSLCVLALVAGLAEAWSTTTTTAFTLSPAAAAFGSSSSSAGKTAARSPCSSDQAPPSPAGGRHFLAVGSASGQRSRGASPLRMSVTEEAPAAAVEDASSSSNNRQQQQQQAVDIPTSLPSECGIDYVPLATMLATGDLKGADQFTRDALIKAAGAGSEKRAFVYWTEVKKIPNTDMATMENLWLAYTKGKFGYSVQKDLWRKTKGDFENFCRRIGWTTTDSEVERKLRWFGANEFIYDVDKAPKGHLPLTSALRGTTLLKELMKHPVWETEWQWE